MKTIISKKYIKNLALGAMSLLTTAIFAQEEEETTSSPFSLSGSIDAYFRTALSTSDANGMYTPEDASTSFANQTGFALGMGNLIGSYEKGDTGAVLDLVFGPRGTEATFGNDVLDGIINQAYAYWNVSDKTTLTVGRFNTWVGYEVIAPAANFNYSVSYLFSNGPFSHIGAKADFAFSDDVSLMLAVTNPWDTNDISGIGEYALGTQLGLYGQYINLYYDSGKNEGLGFEIDYTGGFDVSDDFFLGINAAYSKNSETKTGFYGAALYPQLATSDNFSIGLRGEYFQDTIDDVDDIPGVLGLTLTGSYTKENLIIKPELRLDSWTNDAKPYTDGDLEPTSSLATFLVAAIYTFD